MPIAKLLGIELNVVSIWEKLISAAGAAIAIYCVFICTRSVLSANSSISVVASMGATAVLLFAVPHGPLSQPWPLIGGHMISAIIGVACAHFFLSPAVAAAIAVGASIGAMHQLKCIHPPGGATAFTAVMGGAAIRDLGYGYVICPIMLNAGIMLLLAIIINYPFPWRRYPAFLIPRSSAGKPGRQETSDEMHRKIGSALRSIDSFIDIGEEDLLQLSTVLAKQLAKEAPTAADSQKATDG